MNPRPVLVDDTSHERLQITFAIRSIEVQNVLPVYKIENIPELSEFIRRQLIHRNYVKVVYHKSSAVKRLKCLQHSNIISS